MGKMVIFHSYVSLLEGTIERFWNVWVMSQLMSQLDCLIPNGGKAEDM